MSKQGTKFLILLGIILSMTLIASFIPSHSINANGTNIDTLNLTPSGQKLDSWTVNGSGWGLPTDPHSEDNYFISDSEYDANPGYYYAYYCGNSFSLSNCQTFINPALNNAIILNANLNIRWYSQGAGLTIDMLINTQWQNVVSNYNPGSLSNYSWTNTSYLLNTKGWTTQIVDNFEVKILKNSVPATAGIDYIGLTIQYIPNLNSGNSSVQFSNGGFVSFIMLGVISLIIFLGLIIFVFVDRKKHSFNSRHSSFNNTILQEQTFKGKVSNSDLESSQYSQTGQSYINSPVLQQSDWYCTNCGARLGPSDRFCYKCGKILNT